MTCNPLIRIVDDDEEILDSLKFLLEIAGWQVLTYNDPAAFLAKDDLRIPGVLLLDVRMPGITGLEVQHILDTRGIFLPIIFMSAHGDINMAVRAMQKGAYDFIPKPTPPTQLKASIARAVQDSMEHFKELGERKAQLELYDVLTGREKDVINLVAKGLSNKEIGDKLFLAVPTVKMHRSSAMRKLGIKSAVEAAFFLDKLGQPSKY